MFLIMWFIYRSVRSSKLDSMILMSPFQIEIFSVSAILLSWFIDFREVRNDSVLTLS